MKKRTASDNKPLVVKRGSQVILPISVKKNDSERSGVDSKT
jgi:hypothetical protein